MLKLSPGTDIEARERPLPSPGNVWLDRVDEWGYESFPASDSPQWWCLEQPTGGPWLD